MARPSKLTPQIRDRVAEAIRAGAYRATAAQLVGIAPRTITDWEKRGETEAADVVNPDTTTLVELRQMCRDANQPVSGNKATLAERLIGSSPYAQFSQAIKDAEALSEVEWLEKIAEIGVGEGLEKRTVVTRTEAGGAVTVTETVEYVNRPRWTAFAWLLERRHPEKWARLQRADLPQSEAAAGDAATLLAEGARRLELVKAATE